MFNVRSVDYGIVGENSICQRKSFRANESPLSAAMCWFSIKNITGSMRVGDVAFHTQDVSFVVYNTIIPAIIANTKIALYVYHSS